MPNFLKLTLLSTLLIALSACNGLFETDNTPKPTPLVPFSAEKTPQLQWQSNVNFGVEKEYLQLIPALSAQAIFTAGKQGTVTAVDKSNGNLLWKIETHTPLTAGPLAYQTYLVLGSRNAKVIALHQQDGTKAWETQLTSEILAPPAADKDIVLVKTIDGQLTALAIQDGHVLWRYQQTEPTLILRGGSAPQIAQGQVVVGFANGSLTKLTLQEGSMLWQQVVAIPQGGFAIQRMVDIDANPIIYKKSIYVATYQGKIAALNGETGKEKWSHDLSTFTGLAVDNDRAYVTDANSHVWAFDTATGTVDWRQKQLEARSITGPALYENYLVVGDTEGYLHWLSKQDGHFVARVKVRNAGIMATPVVDKGTLYVLTKDGHLAAYRLG